MDINEQIYQAQVNVWRIKSALYDMSGCGVGGGVYDLCKSYAVELNEAIATLNALRRQQALMIRIGAEVQA